MGRLHRPHSPLIALPLAQNMHPMIDITAIRDEKLQPPFMHTALKIALKLKNRLKIALRSRKEGSWGSDLVKPP